MSERTTQEKFDGAKDILKKTLHLAEAGGQHDPEARADMIKGVTIACNLLASVLNDLERAEELNQEAP